MNHRSSRRESGFTVIELIVVIVFLSVATIFLVLQRNGTAQSALDIQRKTAVNAMYYSLEKVYYPANKAYPEKLTSAVLPSVDPALFKDLNGVNPGESGYEYRYTATDCADGKCKNYTLSVNLQKEGEYTKKSNR